MAGDKKKGGKGAPKLKRSGRHRTKYALQYQRTFKNKLRRVRKHNGDEAARAYQVEHAPSAGRVSTGFAVDAETRKRASR